MKYKQQYINATRFNIHFHFLLHLSFSNIKIISSYHSTFNLCTTSDLIVLLFLGKNRKKTNNVILYVCMSAGNSEMLGFFLRFFPPTVVLTDNFPQSQGKKTQKNVSFYGVCMYVRPKLTFVSFFLCFSCTFP